MNVFSYVFLGFLSVCKAKDCWNAPCNTSKDALNFFVLGDWGGLAFWPYKTPQQYIVAEQLSATQQASPMDFLIALGDNFYFTGVKDVDDERFQDELPIPWYVLAGNHDHYGNVSGQIEYTKRSSRWKFPDYQYTFMYKTASFLAEFIMLDTVVLCGNSAWDPDLVERYLRGQPPKIIFGPEEVKKAEVAWKWVEEKLAQSKANYLFVAGHFPVWSVSEHGPNDCLVKRLNPLLHKYNVTAYFSGHDHSFQHINITSPELKNSVQHVLSGLGCFSDSSQKNINAVPKGSLVFFHPEKSSTGLIGLALGGFVTVNVTPKSANFRYIQGDGLLIHEFAIKPRI